MKSMQKTDCRPCSRQAYEKSLRHKRRMVRWRNILRAMEPGDVRISPVTGKSCLCLAKDVEAGEALLLELGTGTLMFQGFLDGAHRPGRTIAMLADAAGVRLPQGADRLDA